MVEMKRTTQANNISSVFALVRMGRFYEAVNTLEALLAKASDDMELVLAMASLKMYAGEYEEALQLLTEYVQKIPNDGHAYRLISLALAKLHRVEEATEFFNIAREIDPANENNERIESAIYMENNRPIEAFGKLMSYVLAHPDNSWDVWNDLGSLYYLQEQFESAKESFEKASDCAYGMGLVIPFVHFNLALCLNALGEYEEAKQQLSIALEHDAELAPAWSVLGLLVAADGEFERAVDFVERAIRLQPEQPSHWFAMGQIYEMNGDSEAAGHYFAEGYKAYLQLQPDNLGSSEE